MKRIVIWMTLWALLISIGGCYLNLDGSDSARDYYYRNKAYDPHHPFDEGGRHDRGMGGS